MGTQTQQQQRKTLRERGISSFPLSFPHSLKFYTSVCGTTGRDFSDLNHNITDFIAQLPSTIWEFGKARQVELDLAIKLAVAYFSSISI